MKRIPILILILGLLLIPLAAGAVLAAPLISTTQTITQEIVAQPPPPPPVYHPLTVTCDPTEGGSVTLDPSQPAEGYLAGTIVELTATANEGYAFASWSGHLTGSTNPDTIVMYSDKEVTANFVLAVAPPPPFDLWSYDEDGSGYIEIGELLQSIDDYIAGEITISQLLEVINVYMWDAWSYDEDGNGYIEISELCDAINDYMGNEISINQLTEVISLYITHIHE